MWTSAVFISVLCVLQAHQVLGNLHHGQRKSILDAHNKVRAAVSPKPCSPLPALTWDHQLAKVAQHYADKCTYKHNSKRTEQAQRAFPYVGENLYITTHSTADPAAAVKSWEAEKMDYTYEDPECNAQHRRHEICGRCKPHKRCGHYTQVVWNATMKVGCGIKRCETSKITGYPFNRKHHKHAHILVCNYGHGGNIGGQHPYQTKCSAADSQAQVAAAAKSGSNGVQLPTLLSIVVSTMLALFFAKGM